jgi:DNA-binding GntR family transcriptional regulator
VAGLRHEISNILREAIWSGTLKPGQRLNEQWLSAEMGVSRPPLREAIRVLEQEGLVESIPRRGTFVRSLTGQDILEIYTVRCALEGMAAELAMENSSPEALDQLERMVLHVGSIPTEQLPSVISEDLEFHRQLVRLSGNTRLVNMWEQLAGQIRLALTLVDPAFFDSEYVEATHHELVKAIRNRDVEAVRRLIRTLLAVGQSLKDRWDHQAPVGEQQGEPEGGPLEAQRPARF